MAGVSTKEIKNRIRSMESTRQITKAMEMVAASKLRRAQAQIASSRPYFGILYSTIQDILRTNREFVPALTEQYAEAAGVSIGDCFSISKQLSKAFLAGEFDEIRVAYTNFVSVLSQTPQSMRLLPLSKPEQSEDSPRSSLILYEQDSEEVFASIIPEYLGGILYGALCESRASEQAARRAAMDSATQNADDMIADLSLKFNRARQAAITQEITEIVAGS